MYSLGLRNQQEQAKRSQEAIERRHAKPADGARRDHHLLQVYGKTHAEMMSSGQQRREDLIEAATFAPETSSSLRQQVDPPGRVHYHTFRDRSPSREVGPQTVSSLRYVPRAVYGGGGALDRARTAKLENRREPVNALEPRLGTASLHDIATSRGRVRQQTYEAPGYFLRARERSLELGPPLRFEAKNEMERVNSHLESLTIADAGQWAGTLEVNEPVWRTVDQRKWKGLRLRLNTAPATNTTHTVDGRRASAPLNIKEPFVKFNPDLCVSEALPFRPRPSFPSAGAEPRQSSGRRRTPALSFARDEPSTSTLRNSASWASTMKPLKVTPNTSPMSKSCHASLRGVHSKKLIASVSAGTFALTLD